MAVQIASIEEINSPAIVYNFAVETDESYILNGVVSHNCRCTLAPAVDDIPEIPDNNLAEFEDWLNV
jgi:hypothetical protein